MTERSDPHTGDAMVGPHGQAGDHGGEHGHDDHGHAGETVALGPVDVRAWGAAILGLLLGLAVAGAFLVSNGFQLGGG